MSRTTTRRSRAWKLKELFRSKPCCCMFFASFRLQPSGVFLRIPSREVTDEWRRQHWCVTVRRCCHRATARNGRRGASFETRPRHCLARALHAGGTGGTSLSKSHCQCPTECADLAMGKYSGVPPPIGTKRPRRQRLSSKRDEVALLVE